MNPGELQAIESQRQALLPQLVDDLNRIQQVMDDGQRRKSQRI